MLDIAAVSADPEGGMSGPNTWCDRRHRMPDQAQFAHHHHTPLSASLCTGAPGGCDCEGPYSKVLRI